MKLKLPTIAPKKKKIIAAFVYVTTLIVSFFLSKPLFASLAILPLLYACVRFLPRWVSWLPGLVLFFAALLLAENALVHSSRGVSPVTLAWFNIVICLVLAGVCFRRVPKTISWLPCLLLLIAAGSTMKGLWGYESTKKALPSVSESTHVEKTAPEMKSDERATRQEEPVQAPSDKVPENKAE